MDIRKNEPRILSRKDTSFSTISSSSSLSSNLTNIQNNQTSTSTTTTTTSITNDVNEWTRGLDITVTIAGSWSTTRSRVLQYFQQLAVITPYAHLSLQFISNKDSKKNFIAEFIRR